MAASSCDHESSKRRSGDTSILSSLRFLGPGLVTGASDDDPSGIATYSQAGAQFGFGIAWTLLFTYPLMAAIQEISARVGRTTGRGIAANLRQHYSVWILQGIVSLLLIANMINIGSDLGAMGGCGIPIGRRAQEPICRPVCDRLRNHAGIRPIFPLRRCVEMDNPESVRLLRHGFGRRRHMGRGRTRTVHSAVHGAARLLDDGRRNFWNNNKPVSVLLAGLRGG